MDIVCYCQGCYRELESNGDDYCRDCKAALRQPSQEIKHLLHRRHPLAFSRSSDRKHVHRACGCCGIPLGPLSYLCSTCDFALDPRCALDQPPPFIHHPRFHDHSLTLLPRKLPFSCNACGLSDDRSPAYACLQCDIIVHKDCIHFPRVIKITRHPKHRLSRFPSLPRGEWSCGVCFQGIDNRYGGYSCSKAAEAGCSYFAHSKCATRGDVWDGKELEGVPEEPEEGEEDIKAFKNIDGETIQHFLHSEHLLRLVEHHRGDQNSHCKACMLPIHTGESYSCTRCDFALHETCANLPRKKHSSLHQHSLTLVDSLAVLLHPRGDPCFYDADIYPFEFYLTLLACHACSRNHSGFWYRCSEEGCIFELDVRCASISEPFIHKSHHHQLFVLSGERRKDRCKLCWKSNRVLSCIECDFKLGMECATLPDKVCHRYFDEHLLELSCGEDNFSPLWCEACELPLDPNKCFYACSGSNCGVTLHSGCVLGKYPYLKPGFVCTVGGNEYRTAHNNHATRPFCDVCRRRCLDNLVWKGQNLLYCSQGCLIMKIF